MSHTELLSTIKKEQNVLSIPFHLPPFSFCSNGDKIEAERGKQLIHLRKGQAGMMKIRTQTDNRTIHAIDLVKFICAILIILIHVPPFGETDKGTIYYNLNLGIQQYIARPAIPFFFVAAGYFLYRKTTLSTFDVSFSKKYVVRILRLYLIWSLIYLPIVLYEIFTGSGNYLHSVAEYIHRVVFTGSYNHLWYLNGLIVAVCLTSFLLYKGMKPLKIIIIASCLYLIGLLDQSLFGLIVPIREQLPSVWKILKVIGGIIVTTRNGLFFGFLFVAIGMVFAFYDFNLSRTKSLILFIASMILLLAEIVLVRKYRFLREQDMFVFFVPSAFFMFSFVRQIRLKDHKIYKKLRVMSALMFYTHLWVDWIAGMVINAAGFNTRNSCGRFLSVLVITLILSYTICILSGKEKFRWLKKLYT